MQPGKVAKVATDAIGVGSVVEYEQHGKPILGVVRADKRSKWQIQNQHGQELELDGTRLYLYPGKFPDSVKGTEQTSAYFDNLIKEGLLLADTVQLSDLWEIVSEKPRELSIREACEILFQSTDLLPQIATRRLFIADNIYFKRKKIGFEPRPKDTVDELKRQQEAELEHRRVQNDFANELEKVLRGDSKAFPESVHDTLRDIEQLSALGSKAPRAKETIAFLDTLNEKLKLNLQGKSEDKAFSLLVQAKHFDPDQNLELIRLGRLARFPKSVEQDTQRLREILSKQSYNGRVDCTSLLTVTIDGDETQDMDDALSIVPTPQGYEIGIHISDVATVVQPDSLVEREAFRRASSLYFTDIYIPMLPTSLCHDEISLVESKPRLALSFFVQTDKQFRILSRRVQPTVINVRRRLTYREVDELLYADQAHSASRSFGAELDQMLHLLWDAIVAFESHRQQLGAVQFARREMVAKRLPDGKVVLEESDEDTPARKLVGELMITANETAALYAAEHSIPIVYRGQEAPDVDLETVGLHIDNDLAREYFRRSFMKRSIISLEPTPHFGLGLQAYTHCTSPIRRVVDLLNERQILTHLLTGKTFYSFEELGTLLEKLDIHLEEAGQLQRERNRYWLYRYLQQSGLRELRGTVIKVDGPRPLVDVDVIHTLNTFQAASSERAKYWRDAKHLGKNVRLAIDKIDPHRGMLLLREITE